MLNEIAEYERYRKSLDRIKHDFSNTDARKLEYKKEFKDHYERVFFVTLRQIWFSSEIKQIKGTQNKISTVRSMFEEIIDIEAFDNLRKNSSRIYNNYSLERKSNRYSLFSLIADAVNAGTLIDSVYLKNRAVLKDTELIYLLKLCHKLNLSYVDDPSKPSFPKCTTLASLLAILIIYYRANEDRFGTKDGFLRIQLGAFYKWFSARELKTDRRWKWEDNKLIREFLRFDYRDETIDSKNTPFYKFDKVRFSELVDTMCNDAKANGLDLSNKTHVFTDNNIKEELDNIIKDLGCLPGSRKSSLKEYVYGSSSRIDTARKDNAVT